jgi:predicted transcriptional regulator
MATKQRTLSKRAVLKTLKEMPERFEVDDLIERIVLLQKVEEGMSDVKAGRVFTLEEMRAHIRQKWSR